MSEQITTPEELDALPVGSVVMTETRRGFGGGYEQRVWMRHGGQGSPLIHDWQSTDGGFQRVGEPEHARGMWAANRNVTVLYRPDAPSLGADDQAGGPLEGAPKPSAETVADALIRYETGGCCGFGTTCGLCDCGKADETPEQTQTRDAMELDRARAVLAAVPEAQNPAQQPSGCLPGPLDEAQRNDHDQHTPQRCAPSEAELIAVLIGCLGRGDYLSDAVRAITKLYGDQPTVAQAKAEAWDEALAAEFLKPLPANGMRTATPNPYRESHRADRIESEG